VFSVATQGLSHKHSGMPRIRISYNETKIPKEHQKLYGYLSGALTETYESLRAVEKLYMNDVVVARLNSAAPEFFALVRQLLIHNIILCIARLTDKPKTFGQENLTLSRLFLELSYDQKCSNLRARLDKKWKRIEEMSRRVQSYRHKLLAHADKAECLKANTKLGKNITIKFIRQLLKQIADFLNTFDYEFTHVKNDYPVLVRKRQDVTKGLLAYLRRNVVKDAEK
jgi:hypothetical protein